MKIAVTGAAGFVGRYVVSELDRKGISSVLVDRPGATRPSMMQAREFTEFDLREAPHDAFEQMGSPDVLIHLAWGGLPNYGSLYHFEEELPAQYRFLKALLTSGLKKLVVTGTCFEYGMRSGELAENSQPQPANPYAFAKNSLRCELEFLRKTIPFGLTWARLFYVFGEGQAPSSLHSQLTRAIERNDDTFNMSGGEQVRDFLPIETAAENLVSLALSNSSNGLVNVCSGSPIKVKDMVTHWISEKGASITLNLGHYPYSEFEPMEFWGSKAKLDFILASR